MSINFPFSYDCQPIRDHTKVFVESKCRINVLMYHVMSQQSGYMSGCERQRAGEVTVVQYKSLFALTLSWYSNTRAIGRLTVASAEWLVFLEFLHLLKVRYHYSHLSNYFYKIAIKRYLFGCVITVPLLIFISIFKSAFWISNFSTHFNMFSKQFKLWYFIRISKL